MMKSIRKHASVWVGVLALAGLLFLTAPKMMAQQDAPPSGGDADDTFNPPPCDYNDTFYRDNGIVPDSVGASFRRQQWNHAADRPAG